MNRKVMMLAILCCLMTSLQAAKVYKPWENGNLKVSDDRHYLIHENGRPFFWLGNTAWLLPERLTRDEVDFYLSREREEGYNVEQIQVLNAIPTFNIYGRQANDEQFSFAQFTSKNVYGYWDHLDYIVDKAEANGIYIAMDCIWGSQISRMNVQQAATYGRFLGNRYKDKPNIIWMIGGDVLGSKGTESWDALARAIKEVDKNHLMTFHPRGRTTSAQWFNDREWLDFNMFQSGHRRYGQRNGDIDYPIPDNTEEDNWQYVSLSQKPENLKPVIDGEPSYEDIPQGLHDINAPRWQANDVRRYAYWAVFAGCFGHTYGHNSIMQFMRPGLSPAYGASKAWWDALNDPGYKQMKYLKSLMFSFPFTVRVADQSIITGKNGTQYDRIIATRGNDYLLVYNYSGKDMTIDLSKISGQRKNVWLMNPVDGSLKYLGEYNSRRADFSYAISDKNNTDRVLITIDSRQHYLDKNDLYLKEQ
jgi:hypothetical protein